MANREDAPASVGRGIGSGTAIFGDLVKDRHDGEQVDEGPTCCSLIRALDILLNLGRSLPLRRPLDLGLLPFLTFIVTSLVQLAAMELRVSMKRPSGRKK